MKDQVEHRKYPRFQVDYGVVAALADGKLGRISDISRGGLAFSYIDYEDTDHSAASASSEVSIIHDSGFSMLDIPCKVIREGYSPSEHVNGFLVMNTCRIQFYPLTPDQEAHLDYFITHFASGSQSKTH